MRRVLGVVFQSARCSVRNGFPEHLIAGTHGSTYGGNPLGTAVAARALEIINTPELLSHVVARGQQLIQGLNQLNGKYGLF